MQNQTLGRAASRQLLGDAARPWAYAVLICGAVLIAALGALFAHQSTADGFDRAVDMPVIGWFAGHQSLARWLAAPGSLVPAVVVTVAIVIGCVIAGRLNGAILGLAAVPVAEVITEFVLKPLVHRTYLGGVVYPSGHATSVFALAATIFVLLGASPNRTEAQAQAARLLRSLIIAVACLACAGVAIGLIGLRWHYFTDIVAGAAVGIGTVCGLALMLDLPAVRRALDRFGRPAAHT